MKRVNVIGVLSPDGQSLLHCHRQRPPYQGLHNWVGGKVEEGEAPEDAAYRELFEETGIGRGQISLLHLVDFVYPREDLRLEAFFGRLSAPMEVFGEENPLRWLPLAEIDLTDDSRFAGIGNLLHILRYAQVGYPGLFA